MKVSIIVPVYNVEKYIGKCLKSIQNQTLEDFECLVINDGTKDKSVEVAKQTVLADSRFLFFDKANGGLSDARNYGAARAKGEYICFIDSDDYIESNLLELAYKKGKQHDSDIVCFDMYYDFENGKLEYSNGANFEEVTDYQNFPALIYINNSANNKLFKREFLKEKYFIKGMWYEDLAVIPGWLARANNVSHVNKPLYYYVQRQGSITHKADKRIFDIYTALELIKDDLKLQSKDIRKLYFDNCLVMTTIRIKDIDDKNIRRNFYNTHVDLLNKQYKNWLSDILKEDSYNVKQKLIFILLKFKMFSLIDKVYGK